MNPRTMWDGGMEAQTEDKPNQRADILRMVKFRVSLPLMSKAFFPAFAFISTVA
jgi:hypothetical protein